MPLFLSVLLSISFIKGYSPSYFKWLALFQKAIENVAYGTSFKFLIPKEFGGFIKDKYQDYGYLGTKENGEPKYDMYELLAVNLSALFQLKLPISYFLQI